MIKLLPQTGGIFNTHKIPTRMANKKLEVPSTGIPGLKTSLLDMVNISAAHDPEGLRLLLKKGIMRTKQIEPTDHAQ